MINVSDAFKQKLQDGERVWQEVEITFPDGTVKPVKDEIMGENCTFSDCAESSSFPIGCVICKSMTLELDNTSDQWKSYNFYMAKVHAYLKMQTSVASPAVTDELLDENYEPILDQSGGAILATKAATEDRIETIDKGVYTITTPEQYGEILSFTALDDMYKTNATYASKMVLPQTVMSLVRDACETLDIPMGFSSMAHGNLIINEIPDNMTFRQLFGWAAMLETANARLDNRGYLQFVKWDFSAEPIELKDYIDTPTVSSDDIVITGIKVKSGDNSELYGESGYVIELENNLVGEADLATVAAQIGDAIIGAKFRNLQGDMAFNPLLEFGDMTATYDRNMNKYLTPLTDVSYAINGTTTVKTQADDPIRGMSKFVSDGTKAIVEARRLVKIEKTEREKAVERLAGILASSGGLYMTEEPQEDGSTIYYMHNKPTLKESDIIWKLTAEAFAVSVDGGKTYPYGFAVTGELITRLLYAEGINATYINAGTFIVKDKNGKVIFSADMDSGTVKIDASYVQIGGSALDKTLDNMQGQIDGNIETWTGTDTPTLDNYPAKNWLTDDEKSKHVGDVYYDSKNQGYRFRNDGQGYGWQMVKDTDITKALQDSAEAKESAANAEKTAALARNMTFQLSNDMQTITSDADGNIPVFPTVTTTAKVMYGSSDITNDCSYTVTKSDSVTGLWDVDTHTYTVTGLSADNGWVDIKATYLINLSVTKRFTLAKQKQGLEGDKGLPGKSPTIRYASMPDGSDMSDNPKYVKLLDSAGNVISDSTGDTIYTSGEAIYVGFLKADAEVDSTNPSDYEWSRYKGTDGLTQYTHLAYANSADGKTDFSVDSPNREYIGMYVDFTESDSTNPDDYAWSLIKGKDGADGTPGKPGADGKTPYFHVAYANSEDGNTGFSVDDSTNKLYIGQYTDYEVKDSTDPAKYSWTKIKGNDGTPGRTYYLRANTEILLMGQDKKVSPEKLTVNAYYRDGQGEETAFAGWWKAERSSDSGKTWTTITLNQTEATGACTITSSLQIIGSRGMIRVTCYLDQSKTSIADMQTYSVALDVASLTQTEIVKILSDNGKWKGLYYKNGQLYISFSAALGGELALGGANNGNGKLVIRDSAGTQVGYIDNTGVNFTKGTFSGSLNSADGTFTGELSANTGNIAGWVLDNETKQLISPNGIMILDAENEEISINGVTLSAYGNGLVADGGFNIICGTEPFSDGTDGFQIFNLNTLSSGNYLRIHDNLVYMSSSSSKRYKILGASLPEEFIENLYNIEPIMARYKEGYLAKGDERVDAEFPMFIAEDVDKYFPLAVDHMDDKAENWNERIMIPAMFAMLKSQKKKIDEQEKLINKLYEHLNLVKEI